MLMENPILTIFTPTYNRGYILSRCYESLKNQTNKDFIWLIIDDGSTDGTKQLVQNWIKENEIKIRYHFQDNQGMHGAHNTAYNLIDSELNVCIDSDDYMPNDAVEKIIKFWKEFGDETVSGIIGLDAFSNQEIIGTRLPEYLKKSTLYDLYEKHGVKGDKKLVYRTDLTKKHPYPLFEGEKYVGLSYKYLKLDTEYKLLIMNEILCHVEYLTDGSSLNMLMQYKKNPKGFSFLRKELMSLPFSGFLYKFRQAVHYVSSSLLSRNFRFIKETPDKPITILALPFGAMLYLYIMNKTKSVLN
jgi:glycosyltransferase involved in cell wall biosynthesis